MLSNSDIEAPVLHILQTLHEHGFEAYVVGGAVRDLYLGIKPKDYDIATSATPRQTKKIFGNKARVIGRRFRLVHYYHERTIYEISTFRREPSMDERRGRNDDDGVMLWNDNEFGTAEEDARRRDFTVNALFYDPCLGHGIVDHVDGMKDLENGVVRSIGEPHYRLAEDPVRVLRALKLIGQYNFKPTPELEDAMRKVSPEIMKASRSRCYEELLKIFAKPCAASTLQACYEYGFLEFFLPNFADEWGDEECGPMMRKVIEKRDERMAQGGYSDSRRLALATAAAVPVIMELGGEVSQGLWEHEEGIDNQIREVVDSIFFPLQLPKFVSSRTRDVLMNLPRFFIDKGRKRLLGHPEYRYSREILSLLFDVCDWPAETLEEWPVNGTSKPRRNRNRKKNNRNRNRRRSDSKAKNSGASGDSTGGGEASAE